MKIWGNGIDYTTGKLLLEPFDEQSFAEQIQRSLSQNADEIRNLTKATTAGTTYRREVQRMHTTDLGDPIAAGWTFLVNKRDPQYEAIIKSIAPLAEHRAMASAAPLTYDNEPPDEWFDWLLENYSSLNVNKLPHYILVVGGPEHVPFRFQSFLSSVAAVGRVDFGEQQELRTYVEKMIQLEKSRFPVTDRQTICFAPDGGPNDATFFSRNYMAEPIARHVQQKHGLNTLSLMADDATKERFQDTIRRTKPALVYTASHGLGAPSEALAMQKQLNGAICCQHGHGDRSEKWLFAAADIQSDEAFIEGGILFQFACYGYGTPAESDFMHWLGRPELNSQEDFIAALPKKLLAHPRGPVAFIGHVDTAWLHGFSDPEDPYILDRWHPRIEPFIKAVDQLLQVQPVGLAMAGMSKRYDVGNLLLSSTFERLQKNKVKVTPEFMSRLASTFITRNDAQNFMVFGDPAVRLRIPK